MLDRGGLIVNISGRAAQSYRYNVAYGVGKCALDRMTADMALDLADHGVAVISLWPARTRTEHVAAGQDPSRDADEVLETPRFSGRAVVALASDPGVLSRSGKKYWSAELGEVYGFTDEHDRAHAVPDTIVWTPGS
jgi:NAD(P)-dependent dehydrogenase (short-subunit alcohol dehydrogenase family)